MIITSDHGYGDLLVLTEEWSAKHQRMFEDGTVSGLRVPSNRWMPEQLDHEATSIDFISTVADSLVSLEIYSDVIRRVAPANSCTGLRRLAIWCPWRDTLEFANFPQLEDAFLSWRKGASSLRTCSTLRALNLSNFPDPDLSGFVDNRNLEVLKLHSTRKLESLAGLELLTKVRELELYSCSQLANIDALFELPNLERVSVTSCRRTKARDHFKLQAFTQERGIQLTLRDAG